MSVCDCKNGYWHQQLDEASSFLTTFKTELGRFRYTVIPFGATVAGDVFQHKLNQCFGNIKQVIVIAHIIMIVGKKLNHSDHDQASTLLETARRCNVQLNYEELQYKKQTVDFLVKLTPQAVASLIRTKLQQSSRCLHQQTRSKYNHLLEWSTTCPSFQLDCLRLLSPSENWQRTRYLSTGAQNINLHLHRWTKRLQVLPYWLITIPRSKLCYKLMQALKV